MTTQQFLSIWGAGLSTVLAVVHLFSVYRSRTRLSTSYYFDNLEGSADKIIIYNIGKVDIIINDYKLFFAGNRYFGKKDYLDPYSPEDLITIHIKANDKSVLTFAEPDRINLRKQGNRSFYIELSLVGKRGTKKIKVC